jgi:hypothetical protein
METITRSITEFLTWWLALFDIVDPANIKLSVTLAATALFLLLFWFLLSVTIAVIAMPGEVRRSRAAADMKTSRAFQDVEVERLLNSIDNRLVGVKIALESLR